MLTRVLFSLGTWFAFLNFLVRKQYIEAVVMLIICILFVRSLRKYKFIPKDPPHKVYSKLAKIRALTGEEFEEFIGKYLMHLGYAIEPTPRTGDRGIDFHAWKADGSEYAIVQCKNWSNPVGAREVRDLYGTMMAHKADRAILITSSDFTRQAREFAALCDDVVLVSGSTLIQTLHRSA